MKYCSKCGNPMEDEMLFCQKCGTRVANPSTADTAINGLENAQSNKKDVVQGQMGKPRKGMKILALACGVFAIIYALISIITEPFMLSMTAFFGVLALMFFVLSKSPKGNPHLLGKQKGLKKSVFVIICVVLAFALVGIIASQTEMGGTSNKPAGSTSDSTPEYENSDLQQGENNSDDTANVLCDVEQFANITGEELIALLGDPDSISDGTCSGAFEIPCVYYDYNDDEVLGEVSFALVNNEVIRFTSYKDDYEYTGKGSVLEDFGIEKGENCAIAADTGVALRYRCPSDVVDDFWINLIEDDTFGFLQVTYEMMYYEEWYLPMDISEQSNYQYWTQETVKSLLKAPKSADFPNITEWAIVANPFYVAVQSYVDAQNSFGAEVRSDFTFIYIKDTSEIIYAVFDGEVIADNGYVSTADLVAQIAAGNTQE
jgi:hypothetical protein